MQARLEGYRLAYAELLHRLQLPQQRAQVLKLTRAADEKSNQAIIRLASGIEEDLGTKRGSQPHLALALACLQCKTSIDDRFAAYCSKCRTRQKTASCGICHMPLRGLTETCLECLHTSHLDCLQEWRLEETMCPAACGCK